MHKICLQVISRCSNDLFTLSLQMSKNIYPQILVNLKLSYKIGFNLLLYEYAEPISNKYI